MHYRCTSYRDVLCYQALSIIAHGTEMFYVTRHYRCTRYRDVLCYQALSLHKVQRCSMLPGIIYHCTRYRDVLCYQALSLHKVQRCSMLPGILLHKVQRCSMLPGVRGGCQWWRQLGRRRGWYNGMYIDIWVGASKILLFVWEKGGRLMRWVDIWPVIYCKSTFNIIFYFSSIAYFSNIAQLIIHNISYMWMYLT